MFSQNGMNKQMPVLALYSTETPSRVDQVSAPDIDVREPQTEEMLWKFQFNGRSTINRNPNLNKRLSRKANNLPTYLC